MLPNTRLQPTPASRSKLVKEKRRSVFLRGGRSWSKFSEKTPNGVLKFPSRMVLVIRARPSGPRSRILRIGSPRSATIITQRTKLSGNAPPASPASRGRGVRAGAGAGGARAEPPAIGQHRSDKRQNGCLWSSPPRIKQGKRKPRRTARFS
jgi:hypothetical protein